MAGGAQIRLAEARCADNSGPNGTLGTMARTNAGLKRNRLPAGVKARGREVVLAEETADAYDRAARESGALSFSLYLEQLRKQFEAEQGSLPIVGIASNALEAREPAA